MEEDLSHLDLQTEALYPRAIRPSVTIFLKSSFLLQILLFFSTIFEISANKFLSATLAQGIKLYKQNRKVFLKKIDIEKQSNNHIIKKKKKNGNLRYLETIGGVVKRRICWVGEEIELIIGAVVAVAIEAIAAVTAAFHSGSGGLFLVVVFHEALNHFIQANRARLEFRRRRRRNTILFPSGCLFFSRWIPQHAVQWTIKKPLQPRFEHRRLSHVVPDHIDRLDSHRKRHFSRELIIQNLTNNSFNKLTTSKLKCIYKLSASFPVHQFNFHIIRLPPITKKIKISKGSEQNLTPVFTSKIKKNKLTVVRGFRGTRDGGERK